MTFSGRGEEFIFDAIDYIENAYNSSKIKRFSCWAMALFG